MFEMGKVTYSNGTTPNICIVGAGFSGLTAGIKLKTDLGISSFTIFDENEDVGGIWLVNSYPGCACDVQSHLYSWSFEPNPNWSHFYTDGKEILNYMKKATEKYGLYDFIKFNSQVKSLVWEESIKKWKITVFSKETKNIQELFFDIVINAPGALRVPNIPKEFHSFTGQVIHSAAWDSSVDLENKVIAVVGSGSSAIQIIPELAQKAKELHCYQRKPAWVLPKIQQRIPEIVQWLFRNVPLLMLFFRWYLFCLYDVFHAGFMPNSRLSRFLSSSAFFNLNGKIPEDYKHLRNQLTPRYAVGCKRILISNVYYPTFLLPHVSLHTDPIVEVTGNKIRTADGSSRNIDVLVLATGFNVHDYFGPMTITGKDSVDVLTAWKTEDPGGYLGIIASNSPNQFGLLIGHNSASGHNSLIFMLECQMDLVILLLAEMMRRDAVLITPTLAAEDEFKKSLDVQMEKMVWGQSKCGSWYANDKGTVTTIWPFSSTNYWLKTVRPDFNKFDFS